MKIAMRILIVLASALAMGEGRLWAEVPLAKPLAEFEKLMTELKSGSVLGEPIQAGGKTVIPFASIQFSVGSVGAAIAVGGGMGGRVAPMGVLIVDGDEVRMEAVPEGSEQPSLLRQLVQAVLDRKVVIMGNGLNIGKAPGTAAELAPLISGMMGQTTIVGNGLNLGTLDSKGSGTAPAKAMQKKEAGKKDAGH